MHLMDAAKEEDTVPATNGEDVKMKDEEQDADQNGSFQLQFLKEQVDHRIAL